MVSKSKKPVFRSGPKRKDRAADGNVFDGDQDPYDDYSLFGILSRPRRTDGSSSQVEYCFGYLAGPTSDVGDRPTDSKEYIKMKLVSRLPTETKLFCSQNVNEPVYDMYVNHD